MSDAKYGGECVSDWLDVDFWKRELVVRALRNVANAPGGEG